MYHEKGFEKIYLMVMFPETMTETITLKNLKLTQTLYSSWENFKF